MKKHLVIITAAILIAATLGSGCDIVTGAAINNAQNAAPPSNVSDNNARDASSYRPKDSTATGRVHYKKGEVLYFYQKTSFPEGTILQTQLYKDGEPESWWPTDKYIQVQNSFWEVAVWLGENGILPELEIGPFYTLEIWERGNPSSAKEKSGFDLVGPPSNSK